MLTLGSGEFRMLATLLTGWQLIGKTLKGVTADRWLNAGVGLAKTRFPERRQTEMNSESKAVLSGENSRRGFLQKIGVLAAASGMAARAEPPQPATQPPPMPMVRFGKHMVSRLIMGTNPSVGISHLSRMIDEEMTAWHTPERLVKIWKHCEELGINCMEQAEDRVARYNAEHGGKMLFSCTSEVELAKDGSWLDPKPSIKATAALGPIAIHYPGWGESGSDAMWRKGRLNKVREWCRIVRDTGVLVAVNSHRPEVFKEIESQDWDVDFYQTCLYKFGRTKAEWEKSFASNPEMIPAEFGHSREGSSPHYGGEISFVRGDPPEMYKVIKQTRKPCWVYKILAAGRLCENQEFVEAAFREVFANIKPTDAVVVGMYDKYIDQYAMDAEYVRRYGSNTGVS